VWRNLNDAFVFSALNCIDGASSIIFAKNYAWRFSHTLPTPETMVVLSLGIGSPQGNFGNRN
jgi:hypothetical protein